MKESTVAYIAGFFDGEGCVSQRDGAKRRFRITIAQNHRGMLEWIQSELGYGHVYGPYGRGQCSLVIGRRADVEAFARLILPYAKVKRPDLERLLQV